MELLILELIWWAVLFFFFWALRDARGRLNADIESMALLDESHNPTTARSKGFRRPQAVREPIGSYQGQPIFRFADLDGRTYQFDRVCPPEIGGTVDTDELYVAPGLVYQECAAGASG